MKMELERYLVRNRANGVDHYELWSDDPTENGNTEVHANRPTHGDGLFLVCPLSLVVDEEHYDEVGRFAEAVSVVLGEAQEGA